MLIDNLHRPSSFYVQSDFIQFADTKGMTRETFSGMLQGYKADDLRRQLLSTSRPYKNWKVTPLPPPPPPCLLPNPWVNYSFTPR